MMWVQRAENQSVMLSCLNGLCAQDQYQRMIVSWSSERACLYVRVRKRAFQEGDEIMGGLSSLLDLPKVSSLRVRNWAHSAMKSAPEHG